MIFPVKDGIIVRCNPKQKTTFEANGNTFFYALKFSENYREKNPVIAQVVQGNQIIRDDTILICHHNLFAENSPWLLEGELYAIPINKFIFASIDDQGEPHSIGGNIICERIEEKMDDWIIPESHKKKHTDRVIIMEDVDEFKKGDQVFTLPMAPYEICFTWNTIDRRIIKIFKDDIVAIYRK